MEDGRQQGLIPSTTSRTLTGNPFCTDGQENTTKREAMPLTINSDVGMETVGCRRVASWKKRDLSFDATIKPF